MEKYVDVALTIDTPSALTQQSGDIIYHEIEKCFDNQDCVTLDFSNVESMITPFLNNAIGQLYGKYSSEFIKNHLHLKNFPPTKNSTLNIVISNAKKFYKNRDLFSATAKEILNVE